MEEKKESWIEKINKLVNEYVWAEVLDEDCVEVNWEYYFIEYIISKKFWFIKWLVENDKIKLEELKWNFMDLWELAWNTEFIVMLLSIQDNPIEFLISILK